MNYSNRLSAKLFLSVAFVSLISLSCNPKKQPKPGNPKLDKLKLAEGFQADHLYSPSDHEQGSWVSMTFDHKGRLITSDQYGALYRSELPPVGSDTTVKIKIEQLTLASKEDSIPKKIQMGYAHGLLYAFNSLYVMVNNGGDRFEQKSGLYRLQDTDGDDQYDKITSLKLMAGEGEHGPHSILLSPDKKSLYVIAGNHTDLPEMDDFRLPAVWKEDNLFPLIKDPRGHANNRMAPGGWIARTDSVGSRWELVSAGYRNAFDIAFNEEGELFAYDADMEWDIGMPWYRPTRICHVTSGSEYGWRTGNSKWSAAYPDNLPAVINIGQGSPTNLSAGMNTAFPEKYKKSLFAFDWSFGIIYAIHLKPQGSTYTADAEEFLSGVPLPLTDGTVGPDGALYFLTGGRRLGSDLYRVYYNGDTPTSTSSIASEGNQLLQLRKKLEEYHLKTDPGAVDFAWPNLKHEDRFIRYAARVAVEHQPINQWQSRALKETDPVILIQSMIALAHQGKPNLKNEMIKALSAIQYDGLSEAQQIDLLRTFEIILSRMGLPEATVKNQLTGYLNPNYPAKSNSLNRSLSKVLGFLEAPQFVEKTIPLLQTAQDDAPEKWVSNSADLILRNPQYGMDIAKMLSKMPQKEQIYLAIVLSPVKTGWTPDYSEKYFAWFNNAFTYKGGVSYVGFINKARLAALENVPKDKHDYYSKLSGEELLSKSGNDRVEGPQPKGPGHRWTTEESVQMIDSGMVKVNFENGKTMFTAVLCASCHIMRGEGGNIGPDLSQLATRFSTKDMLEAIIEPNKAVSDQYAATVLAMKDGSSILGRLTNETEDSYFISQNPFTPEVVREISKKEVVGKKYSYESIMYPGLINRLNREELKDLMAYLMAGGNPEHEIFKQK